MREVEIDASGQIVKTNSDQFSPSLTVPASASETTPESRSQSGRESFMQADEILEEREGVFVIRAGRAVFIPVVTGIAGDRYFEALSGLNEGDQVITGPFDVVRNITPGDPVRIKEPENENGSLWFGSDLDFRIEF